MSGMRAKDQRLLPILGQESGIEDENIRSKWTELSEIRGSVIISSDLVMRSGK